MWRLKRRAQHPPAVHGIGGKQIESREIKIDPQQAAGQIAGAHEGPGPEVEMGSDSHDNDQPEIKASSRLASGPARAMRMSRFQAERVWASAAVLAVVQLGDPADGQQDDGLCPNARAPGHQGMTELMGQDASEDDAYQGQASPLVGCAMGGILGVPHKQRHQEKGPVDANFNPKHPACRNGPASHANPAGLFRYRHSI